MAFEDDPSWLCFFELNGIKRVMYATSGGTPKEVRGHIQQINPEIKITGLRRGTRKQYDEIKAQMQVNADYVPLAKGELRGIRDNEEPPEPEIEE